MPSCDFDHSDRQFKSPSARTIHSNPHCHDKAIHYSVYDIMLSVHCIIAMLWIFYCSAGHEAKQDLVREENPCLSPETGG